MLFRYAGKGRLEEAKKAMRRINYLGGAETENDLVNVDVGCSERSYTMKDLLEDRTIAKRTAILCILWFATRYIPNFIIE